MVFGLICALLIECFVSFTLVLCNFQSYIIHLQITFNHNLAAHSPLTHRYELNIIYLYMMKPIQKYRYKYIYNKIYNSFLNYSLHDETNVNWDLLTVITFKNILQQQRVFKCQCFEFVSELQSSI